MFLMASASVSLAADSCQHPIDKRLSSELTPVGLFADNALHVY